MESANAHRHLRDQLLYVPSSSSSSSPPSLATSPCYGVGTATTNPWSTPISFLNTNGFSTSYPTETFLNSRETRPGLHQENRTTTLLLSSQYANSMAPDLGTFHWSNTTTAQSGQDLHLSRIKLEELSQHYYCNYNNNSGHQLSNEQRPLLQPNDDLNTRLFLKSVSYGNENIMNNKIQLSPTGDINLHSSSGRGFSQIFPSINISNLNNQPAASASLDINLEALDLLACSRFSGNFGHSSVNHIGLLRDGFSYGSFDHIHQSHQFPFCGSNKVSASSNGVVEAKRSSSKMEQTKAPVQNAPKKTRLEARASCPPFKVRKEKLGDRIAALQQLVAPFGKTDTASVLMEAIGYIKFLQSQVETLSVPYMKASRNKSSTRVMKGGPTHEQESEEPKQRDLKSRGLCLVPLPCLSYITDGGGAAAVWPPPHFGGAT
ncbi:hypothetical protein CDL12_05735 [Handroanthus impetiginosus]|uniref:BHLH domain-containing protein n=1 Tax=Handroanthus impetiginosus TaxID=429701 RepID=A0A2G9HVM5_9LAMI|nr:hypothetical protein CDL12_05735 [Handroanthus impetiginosus]